MADHEEQVEANEISWKIPWNRAEGNSDGTQAIDLGTLLCVWAANFISETS